MCEANVTFTDQLRYITQDASSSQKPTNFQGVHLNAFSYVFSIDRYIIHTKQRSMFEF